MKTFIALFRAINVGGKNSLPMKDLIQLFEEQGFENVASYIQSGNVVFSCKKGQLKGLSDILSSTIEKAYGFKPDVLILEAGTLKEAAGSNPFKSQDEKALHYYFLASTSEKPDLDTLKDVALSSERFELRDKVFYLCAPDGIGRSKLAAKIEKAMGVSVTARNARTVSKLLSMADQ